MNRRVKILNIIKLLEMLDFSLLLAIVIPIHLKNGHKVVFFQWCIFPDIIDGNTSSVRNPYFFYLYITGDCHYGYRYRKMV